MVPPGLEQTNRHADIKGGKGGKKVSEEEEDIRGRGFAGLRPSSI